MPSSKTLVGKTVIRLEDIDSTNRYAMKCLEDHSMGNFLVIANKQTAGKGQGDHIWVSPEGGAYFSFGFSTKDLKNISLLPIVTGLSVRKSLYELFSLEVSLKWVNDILYNNKKLGGILIESRSCENITLIVIGIGININNIQEHYPDRISLKEIYGRTIDIEGVINKTVDCLNAYYELYAKDHFKDLTQEWELYSGSIGKKVLLINENTIGTVIGINENGYLRVVTVENEYVILSTQHIKWLEQGHEK